MYTLSKYIFLSLTSHMNKIGIQIMDDKYVRIHAVLMLTNDISLKPKFVSNFLYLF